MESRIIIGVTDAYTLPPTPGSAYLKTDAAAARRFRVASASVPYAAEVAALPSARDVELFTARGLDEVDGEGEASHAQTGTAVAPGPSTLEMVVSRLRDAASSAHQVWLPPLEPVLALDGLLPAVERDPIRGLAAVGWPGAGRLQVPVGIVDRPRDQAREVLVLDFAGAAGHLAVVGAPQAGKSTLLRTLVTSLALTHTPLEAQVYAVDFGGGGLQGLERLPHVGTVCGRFDPERVQRVVGELSSLVDRRERLFRSRGIESMPAFRALRSTGMEP